MSMMQSLANLPSLGWRALFSGFLAAVAGIGAAVGTARASPLVPIASFLHHWDHHWYIWLRGDPVHEAVEVMAVERGPLPPLVWVFFTERAPPKRQVNYYNDAAAIAASVARGNRAFFAPIRFAMSGNNGGPRGVNAAFDDAEGRAIIINVGVDPSAELSTRGAGLTNQIGHNGDRLLLVFFREKAAYASDSSVTIAGIDVSKPQNGEDHPAPFPTAYSRNIYVGGFPFAAIDVGFGTPAADRLTFNPTGETGIFAAARGELRLITAEGDGLRLYQQRDRTNAHVMEIGFDPPLPSPAKLTPQDAASRFEIALDDFRNLFSGEVSAHRSGSQLTLDWTFDHPTWAQARSLRTSVVLDGDTVSHLELKPVPRE
jgi:hypothetical protein